MVEIQVRRRINRPSWKLFSVKNTDFRLEFSTLCYQRRRPFTFVVVVSLASCRSTNDNSHDNSTRSFDRANAEVRRIRLANIVREVVHTLSAIALVLQLHRSSQNRLRCVGTNFLRRARSTFGPMSKKDSSFLREAQVPSRPPLQDIACNVFGIGEVTHMAFRSTYDLTIDGETTPSSLFDAP